MNREMKIAQIAALSAAALLLSGCKKPPPLGACCSADGSCTNVTQVACSAAWRAGACSPNPCPQPAPPPAVEITMETVAQDMKADARVQFSPDLKVTEENLPLGKAIVHLADAIARGDSKAMKPLLTRRAQGLLDDLTSSGGWDEGTKQIEAVRVVLVRDGVDMGAVGSAHTPTGEVTAGLMAKVTEALAGVPPEQLAAIMKAFTEAAAGVDPVALASNPAKLAEVQGKISEAAKSAGLSDEIVAKLAAIGKDAPAADGADAAAAAAASSGGSGLGVLIAIQDLHGAYLLGWQAEKVGDGWAFTNAPATPEIRPRASLWDNVGPEGFQAMTLASAPAALPMNDDEGKGKGGGSGGGGGGGTPGGPGGESPPSSPPARDPTAPPSRAPGSPGRPPGSGSTGH